MPHKILVWEGKCLGGKHLDVGSFHEHAVVIGLEVWAGLDPSSFPLITLLSFTGSVMSQTKHRSDRASVWPLVIYLESSKLNDS